LQIKFEFLKDVLKNKRSRARPDVLSRLWTRKLKSQMVIRCCFAQIRTFS
jgi:hypothetical protein